MPKSSSRSNPVEFEFELDIGDDVIPSPSEEKQVKKEVPANDSAEDYVVLKRKAKKNKADQIGVAQGEGVAKPEKKGGAVQKNDETLAPEKLAPVRAPATSSKIDPVQESLPLTSDSRSPGRIGRRPGLEGIGLTKDSRNRISRNGKKALLRAVASVREAFVEHGGLAGLSRNKALIAVVLTVCLLFTVIWIVFSGKDDPSPPVSSTLTENKVRGSPSDPANDATATTTAIAEKPSVDLLRAQGGESDQQRNFRARDTLAKFFGSKSPSEMLGCIREPQRVQPFIEDYYSRFAFAMPGIMEISRFQEIMINLKVFLIADIVLEGRGASTVVLQDTEKGFVVDWETYVCYNPFDWDEFYKKRPDQAWPMRVLATLDHNPGFAFPGEAEWVCVRIIGRDSDEELYGYAPAGSETALRLREMLEDEWEFPCILQLQFPEDGKGGDRQVHIKNLVMENWIKVD